MLTTMSQALFDTAKSPPADMVKRIRKGLPADSFIQAAEQLGVSQEVLASKLGLFARTLNRKRKTGENLSSQESERILRVVRVWNQARSLFRIHWVTKGPIPVEIDPRVL